MAQKNSKANISGALSRNWQPMHLTKQECAGALPPESRETAPKMAHSVMVELSLKGEE